MQKLKTIAFLFVFLLGVAWAPAHAVVCDVDSDGDVDRADISLIFAARNTPAIGFDDPRDADGNGTITVLDGRQCVLQCTFSNCTENTPPVAAVTGPEEPVCEGETVILDGSASSDSDDDQLTFQWDLKVPDESTAALDDPNAIMPTFMADVSGEYVAQLVVNDGLVNSDPVTLTIMVEGSEADAGDYQLNVPVGDTVTLDGSGSSSCVGNLLSFQWELTSRPPGSSAELSSPNAVMPTFVADVAGEYVAQLIVNDGTRDSDPDSVTIRTEDMISLNCGDLVPGTIEEAGEVDEFTFTGQAEDVITLTLAETSNWGASYMGVRLTLFSPTGVQVVRFDSNDQKDNITLPETGVYTIRINASDLVSTGSYNLGLVCP